MRLATSVQPSELGEVLQRGWLSRVPSDFRGVVIGLARRRSLEPGAAVFTSGGDDAAVFGIAVGAVEFTSRYGPVHGTPLHIGHPGFWFGFGPIVTGSPRRVSAFALKSTVLLEVPSRPLAEQLRNRPEWWRIMAAPLGEYGDMAAAAAADFQLPDIDQRCIAILLRLADCRFEGGGDTPREIPLSQERLAAMANVSRNRLAALLRELRAQGLVRLSYAAITPIQPRLLRAIVDGDRPFRLPRARK